MGITRNLHSSLQEQLDKHGPTAVANVRALSFLFPQRDAMNEIASQWKDFVQQANGNYLTLPALRDELEFLGISGVLGGNDDDEEDDDDDDNDLEEGYSVDFSVGLNERASQPEQPSQQQQGYDSDQQIISPFSEKAPAVGVAAATGSSLEFTRENVDKVLEEVRPYLVSDGGNVSVERVDEAKGDVYLKLEGACGSCASSTVTMKMGIERYVKR